MCYGALKSNIDRELRPWSILLFYSVQEEITSIRLYTPCNPYIGLRKGVYNLIEVISNEPKR